MTTAPVIPGRIAFAPYELDPAAALLTRGSTRVDLAPKAFDVLRYLAERPGRLVSKKELLEAVWPSVFVTEDVLKVTIAEIRKALGDSPKDPRYIETAHRRGYRFVARTELDTVSQPASNRPVGRTFDPPHSRYARSGEVNIAYQVIGDGPLDLVFVMGWVSHLDYFWTEPSFARFLHGLSRFARVILFDKRGTGLSDRVPNDALPTLEERMDDVRAVMEAAGSRRAVLCGISEGGTMSALFAATYPEKTAGLIMVGAYAKRIRDASYPWGRTPEERDAFLQEILEDWGGPVGLETRAPSMADNAEFREWWAAYLRTSTSPAAAVALTRMNSEADIREVLPAIRVPTLVLHRAGDRCLLAAEGRYLADRIPGATFVPLQGEDHLPFVGDQEAILAEIEAFLTGLEPPARSEPVLATILAIQVGIEAGEPQVPPRTLNRLHDQMARELDWHRGRVFRQSRKSLLAYFDGPARAVRCACAIGHFALQSSIPMQAGAHIGECHVASGKVTGRAVAMAQNIRERAETGQVLVSSTIRDLVVGSGIQFQPIASIPAGGDSGDMALLAASI